MKAKPYVEPLWTLDQCIRLARHVEVILSEVKYHVGVGGGCLHNGESRKDADLIVYPHHDPEAKGVDDVIAHLERNGLTNFEKCDHGEYDDKLVYRCYFNSKRVDVFFLK